MIKTVNFYRFDLLRDYSDNEKFEEVKSYEERKEIFTRFIEKIKENNNTIQVKARGSKKKIAIDVVKDYEGYLFGRLCNPQEAYSYHFRDSESQKITREVGTPYQLLEKFSYFLFDKNNFAISYIKETSAPKITYLADSLSKILEDDRPKIQGRITTLADKDAYSLIAKKDIIGSITYDITIPLMNLEESNLTEEEYLELSNLKPLKVTVQLQPISRNKSTLKGSVEKALNWIGKNSNRATVNAKDKDDNRMTSYLLEDNPLVKYATFEKEDSNTVEEFDNLMLSKLNEIYQNNKREIIEYLGFDAGE